MPRTGLRPRDPSEAHRVASPLELFTDLCYVVAIAQAAAQLHHAISEDHVVSGAIYFCVAFFAIWWAWLNFAWFNSAYDPDDVTHRLLTLLQVFGSLVLAAGIPRIFEGDFRLGVAGYVVMRIGLIGMWIRAVHGHAERRRTALRYAVGLALIQVAWVVSAFATHGEIPLLVFAVLVLGDLLVPIVAEAAGATPWHPHHIAERYGLMFIIVLGEVVLSVTFALQDAYDAEHPPTTLWLVVVGGVLATFSAWWLYFAREASEALSSHSNRSGFTWGFGHYLVYGTIAAFGAGLGRPRRLRDAPRPRERACQRRCHHRSGSPVRPRTLVRPSPDSRRRVCVHGPCSPASQPCWSASLGCRPRRCSSAWCSSCSCSWNLDAAAASM